MADRPTLGYEHCCPKCDTLFNGAICPECSRPFEPIQVSGVPPTPTLGDASIIAWLAKHHGYDIQDAATILTRVRCAEKDLRASSTEAPRPTEAPTYPCDKCGTLRTKDEGGTVFTVCDRCWDERYPTAPTEAQRAYDEARKALPMRQSPGGGVELHAHRHNARFIEAADALRQPPAPQNHQALTKAIYQTQDAAGKHPSLDECEALAVALINAGFGAPQNHEQLLPEKERAMKYPTTMDEAAAFVRLQPETGPRVRAAFDRLDAALVPYSGEVIAARKELGEAVGSTLGRFGHVASERGVLAETLLDVLAQVSCGCSVTEQDSGHRVGCRMPEVRTAADNLRASLGAPLGETEKENTND